MARKHREAAVNGHRYDVAVIGGGPAGSTAAMYLGRLGFSVCLLEKKSFPRETLCGEFLSREVVQVLDDLGLSGDFQALHPNPIASFRYYSEYEYSFATRLKFNAFSMKRGVFDLFLLENAKRSGATIYQPATVKNIGRNEDGHTVTFESSGGDDVLYARYVIGAHGKHSLPGLPSYRNSGKDRVRLNGIKFHIPREQMEAIPENEIQIYTAHGLYCGVNVVDKKTVTVCFLEQRTRDDEKPRSRIIELIKANTHFARATSGEFRESIETLPIYGAGDIYFGAKNLVNNGIIMSGDAARVIAPLAGDGISMAMQSARMIAEVLDEARKKSLNEDRISAIYSDLWNTGFQRRIRVAMGIQRMLFSDVGRSAGAFVISKLPFFLARAIEYTRG